MDKLAINGGEPASPHLIGYGHQVIDGSDVNAVVETLKSDFLTCGPAVSAFEGALQGVTEAQYVTAVANGTAALHVACLAAGINPGDEVIVSPITFAASANCVCYCGGIPVFADIDPKTWNIDPKSIRVNITEKTRAVVAVDFGGVPVAFDEIRAICDEHNLIFIEDAAHSLGTSWQGRPVGSIADITTFSFHPVKTVTTCEGGAVATNDSELARRIELFSKHGITRDANQMVNEYEGGWYYEELELGYNYRLSDVQAALGVSQLARLPEFAKRRQEIVAFYNREFSGIPEASFQFDPTPDESVRHLYCLRFNVESLGTTRRFIYDALRAENIGVNVHYIPVYRLPYYQEVQKPRGMRANCPEADAYYEQAVTLPLHCAMSDEDMANVVKAVHKVIDACRVGEVS